MHFSKPPADPPSKHVVNVDSASTHEYKTRYCLCDIFRGRTTLDAYLMGIRTRITVATSNTMPSMIVIIASLPPNALDRINKPF